MDLLADEIPRSVAQTDPSDGVGVTISTEPVPLPSRYTEAEVQQLLKDAELMTATPISVVSGDRSATITPELLRAWVRPAIVGREVLLRLDEKATVDGLVKLLGRVGRPPRNAKLTVNPDGTVSAEPSETGQRCCTPQSVAALQASLSAPVRAVVQVDLIEEQPAITTEQVVALGVKEPISTFTTKHRAGEDRVQNIHHIADLLRGTVIAPGETFSVNKAIGPRSAANGFIKAHVIEDGVFAENFGGGISQFATTMFNASFFAGLDLVEYQSHSLYISRYPFGREATLSFPRPDLKVRNNTPYGILIWPTYTNSSVTVTLYSTRFATAEAGKPDVKLRDQCKVVTTSRTITFADGTTKKDTVKAIYRPKEGIDCKGNPTAGATTTTVAAPTRTTRKSDSVDTQPGTSKPKTIEAVEPSGDTTTKPSPDTADTKVKVPVSKAPTTKPPAVPRPDPVTPARPPASVVEPAAPPVNVVT